MRKPFHNAAVLCLLLVSCSTNHLLDHDAGATPDAAAADAGATSDASSDHSSRRTLELTVNDSRFSPSTVTASPGERLTVVLHNAGTTAHGFALVLSRSSIIELQGSVAPGQTGSVNFSAPREAGGYPYICPYDDSVIMGQLRVE